MSQALAVTCDCIEDCRGDCIERFLFAYDVAAT